MISRPYKPLGRYTEFRSFNVVVHQSPEEEKCVKDILKNPKYAKLKRAIDTNTSLAQTATNQRLVAQLLSDVIVCATKARNSTKTTTEKTTVKDLTDTDDDSGFEFPDILNETIKIGGKDVPIVYAAGGGIILLFILSKLKF